MRLRSMVLYNLPGPTGIVLTVPIVSALAEHSNGGDERAGGTSTSRSATLRGGRFQCCPAGRDRISRHGGKRRRRASRRGNVLPEQCVALYEHARVTVMQTPSPCSGP
jgi:hypothetical protein